MEKYSYVLLNIVFIVLPMVIFFRRHKKMIFAPKNMKLLIFSVIFGAVGFTIVDPLATSWQAWGYDLHKTLGIITPGGGVIEEFIWAILVAFMLAGVVIVFAEKEEKKKPFWPL